MKYKLVALNVRIAGKTFHKKDKPVLDSSKLPAGDLEAAYKNGFIVPEKEKANNPKEVIELYQKKAKAAAEAEAKEKAKAAAEAEANKDK